MSWDLNRGKKVFDKIQQPFMVENQKINYRRNVFQHSKGLLWQPTANIIFNSKKLKGFFFKSRNTTSIPALTTSIWHSTGSPSKINQARQRDKKHPNQKETSNTDSVSRWHDLIMETPKDSSKKVLELMIKFSLNCKIQNQRVKVGFVSIH